MDEQHWIGGDWIESDGQFVPVDRFAHERRLVRRTILDQAINELRHIKASLEED